MTTLWRYTAVPFKGGKKTRGELAGHSAADVRAALRRIGLQVTQIRPRPRNGPRPRALTSPTRDPARQHVAGTHTADSIVAGRGAFIKFLRSVLPGLRDRLTAHLRRRRRPLLAEIYDSLATMAGSGLTMLESVEALVDARRAHRSGSAQRTMLIHVRESIRGGTSLSQAMTEHPGWFDAMEIAMVRSSEHAGEAPAVIGRLALRHQRSGELTGRVLGALAYPAIVSVVGISVVVFLSTRTLPQLASLLTDNSVAVPGLTRIVMAFGQFVAGWWWALVLALVLAPVVSIVAWKFLDRRILLRDQSSHRRIMRLRSMMISLRPTLVRRLAVAGVCQRLAELLRTGVPMVDALRVLAPTVGQRSLCDHLHRAADAVERGEHIHGAKALGDGYWFDAECTRLIDVGQRTGELGELLDRVGQRYQRQASRLIDRLTRLLEPAVIIALAFGVGLVVMAAILPLLRLQEVL